MYKLNKNSDGIENGVVKDNAFIPFDPDNTDYQTYLKFLEDGGTPLPAENT